MIRAGNVSNPPSPQPGDSENVLRLSRRLVALHAGGIALLIAVVLSTALWISAQHNRLALDSSYQLVENEIGSVRASAFTLIKDYSLWDQGFASVLADDRDWLYSSIGSSVTELGTFDLAILARPWPHSGVWLGARVPAERRIGHSSREPPRRYPWARGQFGRRYLVEPDTDRRV